MFKRIYYWFKSFREVSFLYAKDNLIFVCNLYGDPINIFDARSIWKDQYNNYYKCWTLNK
jgi:hypothetical protein